MFEFSSLIFIKLIALFCLVFLGILARKILRVDRTTIAHLVFYLIAPIVFLNATAKLKIDLATISLPLITAFLSSIIAFIAFKLSKRFFDNETRAIFAFSSANANVGYFLLPIVWELFDEVAASIYVVMILGNNIYENTVGFFIASRGKFSIKESALKIIRLPSLYAMILGFTISSAESIHIPHMFDDVINNIKGTYATLGMMIIGLGLADINEFKIDLKFLGLSFLVKFLLWPLMAIIFIFLDQQFFHIYNSTTHKMLILFSAAPLAANNIVISSVLNLHPEKVSATVALSTVFALFYVPLIISIFGLN